MPPPAGDLAFLAGDGEMARFIREFDWHSTSLGSPHTWPASLRVMVRMALTTGHPVFLFWGPESICLYNDAYSASIGPDKHPGILGMPGEDAWPEIWHIIGPQIEQVLNEGVATWHENQLVPIIRNGRLEDVYWTYSYGPIEDASAPNGIGGVLVLCTETTKQVLASRHLAAEHENFSRLFTQAPAFMALLQGPNHVFQLANPAYLTLVGRDDLVGKTVAEALPEAAGQGYVSILDQVMRTGVPYEGLGAKYSYSLPGQASKTLTLDFVYQPVFDDQGVPNSIFVLGIDATARYAAQEELALREGQLRLATETAGIGLWDLDFVADTLYWTPKVRAIFGVGPDDVPTFDLFKKGVHPQDLDRTLAAFSTSLDPVERAVYDAEFRTIGINDGVVRWVAARGRGLFDECGKCIRAIGVVVDITDRKKVEHELVEKNEALGRRLSEYLAERKLLADIVDGTDAFVQVSDQSFRWLAINEAASNEFHSIYGVKKKVGDSMLELLEHHPDHQAAVKAVWSRALAGEEFNEVAAFGREELHRRFYEMRFRSLRGPAGERIGAYQFVYDVTDRIEGERRLAEAEAALAQAQKMEAVGQLTGGIAHDFNNLLQAIRINFEIVQRFASDPAAVDRHAKKGAEVTSKAAKLTAQLLSFSREHAFEVKGLAAKTVLMQIVPLLHTTLGSSIELVVDLPDEDVWVVADATQLEMAILNVAINARDALEGKGRFELRLRQDGDRFGTLSLSDSGPGMPPEVTSRCFDPFFTTKPVGKGSGLGLSQVYGMCTRVGGQASVKSKLGHGTTIMLRLPLCKPEAGKTDGHAGAVASVHTTRLRVLVVDDDPDVREVMVTGLKSLGHEVNSADNGQQGLQLLAEFRPQILVVDYSMPGMNGAAMARQALDAYPNLRVVFASGYSDVEEIRRAVGHKAELLRKPFSIETLGSAVAGAEAAVSGS